MKDHDMTDDIKETARSLGKAVRDHYEQVPGVEAHDGAGGLAFTATFEAVPMAGGTPDAFEAGEPLKPRPPLVWEEDAPDVFVADIGIYEAKVFDPDLDECWRWSLELVGDLDPKIDSASGFFAGDVDGAKARAEEMAAVLSQHMERSTVEAGS